MTADRPRDDLRCIEVVEMLTAYLDGVLDGAAQRRFEVHLQGCEGCRTALAQWQTVTDITARLTPEEIASLDPYVLNRFRSAVTAVRRK